MAKDCSFDVVSKFDPQEMVNAVEQVKKELQNRFDLKGTDSKVELDGEKTITITTVDETKLKNIFLILEEKMMKRSLNLKILKPNKVEHALGGNVRQVIDLQSGIEKDFAKKIVSFIKDTKLKVQSSIQGDSVRVSGKNKDDLQDIINKLKEAQKDFEQPLQFENYR